MPTILQSSSKKQTALAQLSSVIDGLRKSRGQSIILRGHDLRLKRTPREALEKPPKPRAAIRIHLTPAATYVPLRVHSHYSFLDSTLSPAAIVKQAKEFGMRSVAMTDTGNLHGAVQFVQAARKEGIKPILRTELSVEGKPLLLYVESSRGYTNLCRILSAHLAHTRDVEREEAVSTQERRSIRRRELEGFTEGLIAVSGDSTLSHLFPKAFYALVTQEAQSGSIPYVACPSIHYGASEDRQKYDILQSIRTLTLLREKHPEKRPDGRFHFRSPRELSVSCREHPEWLSHSLEIGERCNFDLPLGAPLQFPDFSPPDGSTPRAFLRSLVLSGLQRRYREKAKKHLPQIEEELRTIATVGYEGYFLITWELLEQCKAHGIEWITRGSAADSLVCYCLGISDVCPIRFDLYFKRFLNAERMALNKAADIDLDFPHDRKDDVVRLLFSKYGSAHCAVVGGFSTFQSRSAFAETAKVLGVSEREVRKFSEHFPWHFGGGWVPDGPAPTGGSELVQLLRERPETKNLPFTEEPYRTALEMASFLNTVPRYPKMHPCGLVLSRQPMHELTPTFTSAKGLPTTHFDMDGVEEMGLVKMDILAQGGLAVMRDTRESLHRRGVTVDLGALEPWEDPTVWEMISSGGARAVHHIESPAMTTLHKMTNVKEIDGLVAIVSVIRPGAANEQKKLSFTRRYQGLEPVTYPDPTLQECLRSTYGLVVYEEHILQISEAFARLAAGRADVLRRALVKQKKDAVAEIGKEFFASARARGHTEERIQSVWELVTGFSGYAFNRAHSTAYGIEAYQAAWLKLNFPTEFMAGVLTHGKGFYHPLVYVLECHRLGLKLLPPSVNEPGPAFVPHEEAIRVPVTRMKGMTEITRESILKAFSARPFLSMGDFFRRVFPTGEELEGMIRLGAFDEFGETRTRQFWQGQHLLRTFGGRAEGGQGWLLPPPVLEATPKTPLSEPTRMERLRVETELLGFAASWHPLELWPEVAWETYCPVERLGEFAGQTVVTCGLVVEQRTHHQITGEPMKFLTIADWTGMAETELFAKTYRAYGLSTVRYPVLEIEAKVESFENGRGFSLRVLRAGKPRIVNKNRNTEQSEEQ